MSLYYWTYLKFLIVKFIYRMNLFLGVFVPNKNRPALWDRDAPQDVYLHSPEICRSVDKTNQFWYYVLKIVLT